MLVQVVDDSEINRAILGAVVEKLGDQVRGLLCGRRRGAGRLRGGHARPHRPRLHDAGHGRPRVRRARARAARREGGADRDDHRRHRPAGQAPGARPRGDGLSDQDGVLQLRDAGQTGQPRSPAAQLSPAPGPEPVAGRGGPQGHREVAAPGPPRPAHRPAQPRVFDERLGRRSAARRAGDRSPCCSSTSTGSRRSTTRSATTRATLLREVAERLRDACAARTTRSPASAATSSRSSARRPTPRTRRDLAQRIARRAARAVHARRASRSTSRPASASRCARPTAHDGRDCCCARRHRDVRREGRAGGAAYPASSPTCERPQRRAASSGDLRHALTSDELASTTSRSSISQTAHVVGSRRSCAGTTPARAARARRVHPARRGDRAHRRLGERVLDAGLRGSWRGSPAPSSVSP